MSTRNTKKFNKQEIEFAISQGVTMGAAAKVLNLDWRTFRKQAEKHGLYERVPYSNTKLNLDDILAGKHPQYSTSHLSKRLVKEGIKQYTCESCGITDWQNNPISLELDHIDGNNSNHKLENLRLLCPNCHSQTETYKSKKLSFVKKETK
jgi:5-methylcytosine-specific restriction endonuclease McrA